MNSRYRQITATFAGALLLIGASSVALAQGGASGAAVQKNAVQKPAELKPHRAIYSMFLTKSETSGAISAARGAMVYEFKDSCDAWTVNSQVYMRLRYGRGPEVENVRRMATWESKDGVGYRFHVKESQGGRAGPEIKGVAALDETGKKGVAEFTQPRSFTVELPEGTVFPTGHIADLISGASGGGKHIGRVVFDGTTVDNPYEVSALIEGKPKKSAMPSAIAKKIGAVPFWNARLAYFPYHDKAETPEFELGVEYREDGIISRILQDFGDYGIEARLDRLEILPPESC